jgi:hypothetical protein
MIPSNRATRSFPSTPPNTPPSTPPHAGVATPSGTPPRGGGPAAALTPRVSAALENVLPGLDANKLFKSLDNLFGNRGNYTVVGSASMHLHALETSSDAKLPLPLPNDIDLVVTDRGIDRLNLANPQKLSDLGFRRDADLAHVLYVKRVGQDDLKIDVVAGKTSGFKKYVANPHDIDNVQVGRLEDSLNDYRARMKDPEFIHQCGGEAAAEKKIQPWLNYFNQSAAQSQDSASAGPDIKKRRLAF